MDSENKERRGGWLARWRAPKRQERQIATLQEGFYELVGLTRSIREHMEQQALTQATLVSMLEHMPGAVEGLKSVGEATKQQTETLQLLKQQLEAAARNESLMVDSMGSFNKTLTLMDDMSKQTSQTVKTMADRTRDSEDMLRNLLERSERRLISMIVTLMIVTLSVLGVGLYIGLGQRADEPVPPTPPAMDLPPAAEPDEPIAAFEHNKRVTDLSDAVEAEAPETEERVEIDEVIIEPVEEEEVDVSPVDTDEEPETVVDDEDDEIAEEADIEADADEDTEASDDAADTDREP